MVFVLLMCDALAIIVCMTIAILALAHFLFYHLFSVSIRMHLLNLVGVLT